MNKQEFLSELKDRLEGIPVADRESTLEYYSEMIDDRIESGISEEEAVESIGSIDSVAEQILYEFPIKKLVREKVKPRRTLRVWEIALLILGAPLWLPILLSAVIVAVSIIISFWCVIGVVIISLYATDLAIALGGIAAMLVSIPLFITGRPVAALMLIGAGLILTGLSILLFLIFNLIVKGVIYLIRKLFIGFKLLLFGRRKEK